MSLYFERIVSPHTFPVEKLICLSETRRQEKYEEYVEKLDELLEALKKPSAKLLCQPLFVWDKVGESPCWLFTRHEALHRLFCNAAQEAETLLHEEKFEEAAEKFGRASGYALCLVANRNRWTAIQPELTRQPLFIPAYLISLVANVKSMQQFALYKHHAKEDSKWKFGNVTTDILNSEKTAKLAAQYTQLANLLWAREEKGQFTYGKSEFEETLITAWHRTASYAASSFQERLSHAACCTQFEDSRSVLQTNDSLYFLEAVPAKDPELISVAELF